VDVNQLILHT
jgi:TolA-binding protein